MIREAGYQLYLDGKRLTLPSSKSPLLAQMAKPDSRVITNRDIKDFLEHKARLVEWGEGCNNKVVADFKRCLAGKPLKCAPLYPKYEGYVGEMRNLEARYPGLATMVRYGNAANGTPLYALKVTGGAKEDGSEKPAVLFTGLIHAREWATGMVTMETARNLLEGYGTDLETTRRLDQAEVWFIPVVNPEGYDYSKTVDSFWRKNRAVIYQDQTACPPRGAAHEKVGEGVDLNRNFWDPKHRSLYRTSGDSACSTRDDFGASDDPEAEDYRGPYGASEPEIRALQDFMAGHKNLIGIIDHHSYGNQILYPWGHTDQPVENVQEYLDAAEAMKRAGGSNFKIQQSVGLYPTTGSSEDYEHVNGIFNFTLEIGTHFHSSKTELEKLMKQVPRMDMAFIDWVLAHKAGQVPAKAVA